jgi:beta-lactamase regulating signal transducer with metallopeptidase domain
VDELIRLGLTNAAWAAALALAAAVGTRALRRRPAVAHVLWLLVLIKLVAPTLVRVEFPGISALGHDSPERVKARAARSFGRALETPTSDVLSSTSPRQTPVEHFPARVERAAETTLAQTVRTTSSWWPWRVVVVANWLAGACAWWVIVGMSSSRFRRLMRTARAASFDLEDRMRHLAVRLNLRRLPTIGIVPARVPPMLWAPLIGSPRLLLPEELWARFDIAQQDTVLVHELAHLKRRDHWVRRFEALVMGLYWWNPVAWWARRQLERTEEECCDAWVAWVLPAAVGAYAEALVTSAVFLSGLRQPLPIGASKAGRTLPLKRRLNMIVSDRPGRSISGFVPRLLLGIGVLSLPFLPAVAAARPAQIMAQVPQTPSPSGSETAKGTEPKDQGPGIRVIQPAIKVVGEYVDAAENGRLDPMNRIEIRARAKGLVVKAHCKPAQRVKKGDLLFEIDPATYKVVRPRPAGLKGRSRKLKRRYRRPRPVGISRSSSLIARGW